MESPSVEFVRKLSELKLFPIDELHRCRSRVKRLASGLPLVDSLWVDALVEAKQLTPFQARMLESTTPEDLKVSHEFVITDQLVIDQFLHVCRAQRVNGKDAALVSIFKTASHDADAIESRVQQLIQQGQQSAGARNVLPFAVEKDSNRVCVFAPMQSGQPLSQFMIRRGRFPERVVTAIANAIVKQLNQQSLPHGDLRSENLWLSKNGTLSTVNWGILSALVPEISVHTTLPSPYLNGIAPERIGTGSPASTTTEMYALGCLLWQLLAGRPPLAMADPLVKLMAHQRKLIPDIRTIAPETSPQLAKIIRNLTWHEPHRRPASWSALLSDLRPLNRTPDGTLRRFCVSFESAAPRLSGHKPVRGTSPWMTATAITCVSLAALFVAWNRESLGLSSLSNLAASVQTTTDTNTPHEANRTGLSPGTFANAIPDADENGTILLGSGTTYHARSFQASSPLRFSADPLAPATIIVEQLTELISPALRFENVRIIVKGPQAGLNLHTDELRLSRCSLVNETDGTIPTIQWERRYSETEHTGRLLATETRFRGNGTVFKLNVPLTTAGFEQIERVGSGPFLDLQAGVEAGLRVPVVISNGTFRSSGPLVACRGDAVATSGRLSMQGSDTVIDLQSDAALVSFHGDSLPVDWYQHLEINAAGWVIASDISLVQHQLGRDVFPLDDSNLTVDGLLTGEFGFVPSSQNPTELELVIESLPVQLSAEKPGCDLRRLLSILP